MTNCRDAFAEDKKPCWRLCNKWQTKQNHWQDKSWTQFFCSTSDLAKSQCIYLRTRKACFNSKSLFIKLNHTFIKSWEHIKQEQELALSNRIWEILVWEKFYEQFWCQNKFEALYTFEKSTSSIICLRQTLPKCSSDSFSLAYLCNQCWKLHRSIDWT